MIIDSPKYDEVKDEEGEVKNKKTKKKIINLSEETSEDFIKNIF